MHVRQPQAMRHTLLRERFFYTVKTSFYVQVGGVTHPKVYFYAAVAHPHGFSRAWKNKNLKKIQKIKNLESGSGAGLGRRPHGEEAAVEDPLRLVVMAAASAAAGSALVGLHIARRQPRAPPDARHPSLADLGRRKEEGTDPREGGRQIHAGVGRRLSDPAWRHRTAAVETGEERRGEDGEKEIERR